MTALCFDQHTDDLSSSRNMISLQPISTRLLCSTDTKQSWTRAAPLGRSPSAAPEGPSVRAARRPLRHVFHPKVYDWSIMLLVGSVRPCQHEVCWLLLSVAALCYLCVFMWIGPFIRWCLQRGNVLYQSQKRAHTHKSTHLHTWTLSGVFHYFLSLSLCLSTLLFSPAYKFKERGSLVCDNGWIRLIKQTVIVVIWSH